MDAKRNSSFAAKIKKGVRNMRSTFNILFYVNKSKAKNGVVPVMGRVTINDFYKVVGKANDFIKVQL